MLHSASGCVSQERGDDDDLPYCQGKEISCQRSKRILADENRHLVFTFLVLSLLPWQAAFFPSRYLSLSNVSILSPSVLRLCVVIFSSEGIRARIPSWCLSASVCSMPNLRKGGATKSLVLVVVALWELQIETTQGLLMEIASRMTIICRSSRTGGDGGPMLPIGSEGLSTTNSSRRRREKRREVNPSMDRRVQLLFRSCGHVRQKSRRREV